MRYVPHEYQRYTIDYIVSHPVEAVFLDCGMGKSSITLTAVMDLMFDRFEVGKVLVVAPLRVARNAWPDEIEKWNHTRFLTYTVVTGTEKERRDALIKNADITIINREDVQWLVERSDHPFNYDMLVVDELGYSIDYVFKVHMKALEMVDVPFDK